MKTQHVVSVLKLSESHNLFAATLAMATDLVTFLSLHPVVAGFIAKDVVNMVEQATAGKDVSIKLGKASLSPSKSASAKPKSIKVSTLTEGDKLPLTSCVRLVVLCEHVQGLAKCGLVPTRVQPIKNDCLAPTEVRALALIEGQCEKMISEYDALCLAETTAGATS
jgi:hypothetical protein